MNHRKTLAQSLALSLLLGTALIANGKPKNQKDLPAIFRNAQFVYVEAYNGDEFNPRVVPDDRRAIYNVEQSLKDWKRYSVALERKQAELVFLVRKGRIVSAAARVGVQAGRPIGNRNNPDPSNSDPARNDNSGVLVGVDADAGPAEDLLEVYLVTPSGDLNGPIWSHRLDGGLDAPAMPLFQRIKHEVDTTYPQ